MSCSNHNPTKMYHFFFFFGFQFFPINPHSARAHHVCGYEIGEGTSSPTFGRVSPNLGLKMGFLIFLQFFSLKLDFIA
jgi:hypothetical protein